MSLGQVVERYAQAIFELGQEHDLLGSLCQGMADFGSNYDKSADLREVLSNPLIPKDQVAQALRSVAQQSGVPDLGISALLVLWKRNRLSAITAIAARLSELRDNQEGIVRAHLTTAVQMPDSYYQAVSDRIAQATHKRVILEHQVDSQLVAGAVARVGGSVLDASVQGRLTKFKQQVLSALAAGSL
jgi:F-type H+-transporting ATPase subunit delta